MTKEPNIGHDPLAWMAEGTEKEELQQPIELSQNSENHSIEGESKQLFDVESTSSKNAVKSENSEVSTELKPSDLPKIDEMKADKNSEKTNDSPPSKLLDMSTHEVIQVSGEGEWITIQLPANMTLPYLDDLQAQLHDFLGQHIHFSAENVQRVDTASLQLLISFIREDKGIRWGNPSRALCDSANLLNLSKHLHLPTE
jgi:ABC-type transporter Mla MlaB component